MAGKTTSLGPSSKVQLACAWSGPVMVAAVFLGWILAGILPIPPAANDSAAQIMAFYSDDPSAIRAGLLLATIGMSGGGLLSAVVAIQMLRMEGRAPILTFIQLITGAVTWILLIVPTIMLNIVAFRPDRSPELTVTLNDLAWLLFLTPIGPFVVQTVVIGLAILGDGAARPVLPRWVGYTNLWIAFLFCPAVCSYFFKNGPFAWQGIFCFWLGAAAYAAWAIVMGLTIRRAVLDEAAEDATVDTPRVAA
ncbi:hypothetical protein [Pseudonocardia spinosispora]|uniref:hypothetical protein n=1 Tax=Pseudonocardia spinosispora TaxID=103441 RepID=UPI00041DC31F|nr:hypothetical protein [Pseudonocardia spinosispora]